MMAYRLLTIALLSVLIILAPYWIYLPAIMLALVIFPFFLEGIIFGLLIDVLYGVSEGGFFLWDFPLALVAGGLVVIMPVVRSRLRLHV